MTHIKAQQSNIIEYPYSIVKLKRDNPDTSFPSKLTSDLLASYDVYLVSQEPKPEYDDITHKLTETSPQYDGTGYVQGWSIGVCSEEEEQANIASYDRKQESLRKAEYNKESDPLFFKWQRGEATEQDWLNKVQTIKQQYPKYGE